MSKSFKNTASEYKRYLFIVAIAVFSIVGLQVVASGTTAGSRASAVAPKPFFHTWYNVPKLIPDSGWEVLQSPKNPWSTDGPYLTRITTQKGTAVMGSGAYKPANAMRVDLHPGDVQTVQANGNVRHASEVYGLYSKVGSNATADKWPLGVNKEAWIHFNFGLDPSFTPATVSSDWMDFMQLKGKWGGSPPVALSAKLGNLEVGSISDARTIGALPIGKWTDLLIGVYLSPDKSKGWLEVYRDGKQVVARTPYATMDLDKWKNGTSTNPVPDPAYLKQGIYRGDAHQTRAIAWFGPTNVTRTKPAL